MRADGVRRGVDDLGGAGVLGREPAGAVGHAAVGERRAVLDDQHPLAANQLRVVDR